MTGIAMPMTYTEEIILALSKGCRTLEELQERTGLERGELLVYLSRMYKRGLIYRKWRKFGGRKYREYCLKEYYKR